MENKKGNTSIKSNHGNNNQYKNFPMNNPPNYNRNNNIGINPLTYNMINRNLINKDNNIDYNINQNAKKKDKKAQKQIYKNQNLNPQKEFNSIKKLNKKEISNNNKYNNNIDFEKYVTPNGEDTQDLRNYYKYVLNERTDIKKNNNNNNPSNQNEKEENELNNNPSFSLSEYKKPCLVSIENIGNSSYMSAILRILSSIKYLVKYYLIELNNINNYLLEIPISYAFSRIIFHLYPFPQDSLKKSISLDNFYRTTLLINPTFKGTSTKNGIDFLNFLLDTLHNDDKFFRNKNNNINNNNQINNQSFKEYVLYLEEKEKSIIFDNFAWISQKIRKCTICEEEKTTYQYYFTYDLNILNSLEKIVMDSNKKDINIYDCINEQSNKKRLHNVYCYNCKIKTIFEEENSIYTPPKYFIFLLRVNEDEALNKIKENDKKIRIDENLCLKKLIKAQQKKEYEYRPIGKVDYNFKNKEYISSCCDLIDNKWYKYENNQNKISKIQFTELYNNFDILPVIVLYKIKK